MRNIQKNIDKKLIQKLYKTLQKKPLEKIRQMAEAFVGVLENEENPEPSAITGYFANPDALFEKLNNANPKKTTEAVAEKHFDLIKRITKSFIDSATENFKECSNFASFLAWVTQYVILIRYTQGEEKAEKSMISI